MTGLWGREPAAVLAAVQSVLALVVVLGFNLPDGADAAILAVSAALLGLLTRSQVSPAAPVVYDEAGDHAA